MGRHRRPAPLPVQRALVDVAQHVIGSHCHDDMSTEQLQAILWRTYRSQYTAAVGVQPGPGTFVSAVGTVVPAVATGRGLCCGTATHGRCFTVTPGSCASAFDDPEHRVP